MTDATRIAELTEALQAIAYMADRAPKDIPAQHSIEIIGERARKALAATEEA